MSYGAETGKMILLTYGVSNFNTKHKGSKPPHLVEIRDS
jgi:hypothetical protein